MPRQLPRGAFREPMPAGQLTRQLLSEGPRYFVNHKGREPDWLAIYLATLGNRPADSPRDGDMTRGSGKSPVRGSPLAR